MAKDINAHIFDEGTQVKLDIFAKCFKEWLPVFINTPSIRYIAVFDFFAGSGTDTVNHSGSPLLLLETASGKYCRMAIEKNKKVIFYFNEKDGRKYEALDKTVRSYIQNCLKKCSREDCFYDICIECKVFKDGFTNGEIQKTLEDGSVAKFVLLDQYGWSQVDDDVFLKLARSPTTDFIFFVSSSFVERFANTDYVKRYFDTNKIAFDEGRPQDCHRQLADYFRHLSPKSYVHQFTIKKGSNYWGLIFVSSHSYGMEKFLNVCWTEDEYSGEANFNINNDFNEGDLFFDKDKSNKKERFKMEIKQKILAGDFGTNIEGLDWTLRQGCRPKLFVDAMKELLGARKVSCSLRFNEQAAKIHKVTEYTIEVL